MKDYNGAIAKLHFKKTTLSQLIGPSVLASSLLALTVNQAHAVSWDFEKGITVDLDTSLTYDAQWRVEDRDNTIITAGGG
ncbi:MAG: DUF1302 family protein, partial [Oceanospirillaceae bacterium]